MVPLWVASRDTLLAQPADCGSGCEAASPAPDASQHRVEAAAITGLSDKMKVGALSDLRSGEFTIVIGSDLARALGVKLNDKIMLVAPQGQITPVGMMPRLKQFR